MFRRFARHIKEGFYGVARHGAMAISSASAVTITLCLISIFFIFSYNVDTITTSIEDTVQISVKISFDHEGSEQLNEINRQIKAIDGVTNTTFYTKEEELQYYIDMNSEDEEAQAIFEPYKEDNPFHHMYYVDVESGDSVQSIANRISQIEGVDDVNYGGDSAVMLINALDSVRYGGMILVISLSALAIFLIANTIKLTIYARNREISIMRSVGATNGYIRAPFVIEGMIIGFLGAVIPVLLSVFGYIYLYNYLGGQWFSNLFVMVAPHPFVLWMALILVAVGVLVGLVGSFLSVSKYLRWKR